MVFFSIVIPTYNRAKLISETVLSVANQSYYNFEIIVVDDGSVDNTGEVIHDLGIEKLTYFKIKNSERGYARNFGYRKASGDFVVFLDSDDLMKPNHLQVLYEGIHKYNVPHFIASKFEFVNDKGKIRSAGIKKLKEGAYNYSDFLEGNFMACNFCVKRDNSRLILFEENRSYAIMEDWMFLILNLKKDKIWIVDQVSVQMRDHDSRSMNNNQVVIDKRLKAMVWLKKNVSLTTAEQKKLEAHSFYFCSIHFYLDKKPVESLRYLWQAVTRKGINIRFLVLLAKIILLPRRKN